MNTVIIGEQVERDCPNLVVAPPQMSGRKRALRNTFWNVLAVGFSQGSTFAVNIFAARILGKQVFGEFAMIQSTLVTTAALVQLAMGYTAAKYVAEFRSTDKERAGRILGLCSLATIAIACVGALLLGATAPWTAANLLGKPALGRPLAIGTGFVLFSAINGYQIGALAGLEAFRSLARAGIISGIIVVAGTTVGAWYGALNGAIVALTLTAMVRCVIHRVYMRNQLNEQGIMLRYDKLASEKKAIFGFALPAALSGYISLPALWLGNSFLVRQPGGYEQMALYSAATNLRTLVMFLPVVINNVGLSMLNNLKGVGNLGLYRKTYRTSITVNAAIVAIGSLVLMLASPFLLRLFGNAFIDAKTILAILLMAALAEAIASTMYQVIQTHAKMWLSLLCIAAPNYITFVLVAYMLCGRYGGRGLALAYLAEWCVALVTIGVFVKSLKSDTASIATISSASS